MNAVGFKALFLPVIIFFLFSPVKSNALSFDEFIENIADNALESSFDYKILREEYFQSET